MVARRASDHRPRARRLWVVTSHYLLLKELGAAVDAAALVHLSAGNGSDVDDVPAVALSHSWNHCLKCQLKAMIRFPFGLTAAS